VSIKVDSGYYRPTGKELAARHQAGTKPGPCGDQVCTNGGNLSEQGTIPRQEDGNFLAMPTWNLSHLCYNEEYSSLGQCPTSLEMCNSGRSIPSVCARGRGVGWCPQGVPTGTVRCLFPASGRRRFPIDSRSGLADNAMEQEDGEGVTPRNRFPAHGTRQRRRVVTKAEKTKRIDLVYKFAQIKKDRGDNRPLSEIVAEIIRGMVTL